jgi:hypothetical protein
MAEIVKQVIGILHPLLRFLHRSVAETNGFELIKQ